MGFGDQMILDTEPVDDGTSDGDEDAVGVDLVVVDSEEEEEDEGPENFRNVVGLSGIRGIGDHVILDTEPVDEGDGTSDGYEEGVRVDLFVVDSEEDEGSENFRNVVGLSRICGDGASAGNMDIEKEGVLNHTGFEEPVDLSQANALDFVDQFVSSNRVEYSPLVQPGDPDRKVSPDSRSSGSQTIARYVMSRAKERKTGGAFEWDDSNELEDGDSFGGGMNVSSDSRRGKNEFRNQDACGIMRRGQNSSNNAEAIGLETHDVGYITQIAAEAMEALSHDHPKQDCPGPWSCFQGYHSDVGKKLVDSGKLSVHDSNFPVLEGISTVPKRKRSKARRGTNELSWKHCSFRAAAGFQETAKNNRRELSSKDLSDNISLPADRSIPRKFTVHGDRQEPVLEQENCQSPLTTNASLGKQRVQVNPFNQGNGDGKNDCKLTRTGEDLDGHRERKNAVTESPLITYRRKKILGRQQVQENSQINWNEMREGGSTKTIFGPNEPGERRNAMAGSPLITYRRKKSLAKRQAQVNSQMNWTGMTDSRSSRPMCRSGEHGESTDRATESPIITYKRRRKQSEVPNAALILSGQSSEVDMNDTAKTCLLDLHTKGHSKGEKARSSLQRLTRTLKTGDKSMESKMEDWHEESFNKDIPKLSLLKELVRPVAPDSAAHDEILKDIRKRRNARVVSVLFSQHLDDNILKRQKRISSRMRIPVASCITYATHFMADRFARTRNMLEAIALGKPVVTHLWLESCCQVGCLIDERNYILRDAKKEKEIGFSLPVSLSSALQHPLLKGCRVLVTPNVKPNKDTILSLVKAAHGAIAEHDQIKAPRNPAGILILSCEEDYAICLPFLEQGAAAYSPELILNGTIIQKLEYERHQLFRHYMKQ